MLIILTLIALGAIIFAACARKPGKHSIEVNGVSLVYEVSGKGKPVILLHGNGGSRHDLDTERKQLVKAGYKVYAPDSRGQGENAPLKEYHYKDMAEDIYQFINKLGLEKPAVYGWSDGGIIALELEIMHPGTSSMILCAGANAWIPFTTPEKFEEFFSELDPEEPLVKLMLTEPDMTTEELSTIKCPALICAGENDLVIESQTREIAESIPDAELLIVEGHDHGSYIVNNPLMGEIIIKFLRSRNYQ